MRGPDEKNSKKHEKKKEEEDGVDEKREEGIGQGELYSPEYAVKIPNNQHKPAASPSSVERRMGMVRDRLVVKLAAATDGQQNSHQLDKAKSFIETVTTDATLAVEGISKEGLKRIKSHMSDVFPSLTSKGGHVCTQMVDDAEKEAEDEDAGEHQQQQPMSKL